MMRVKESVQQSRFVAFRCHLIVTRYLLRLNSSHSGFVLSKYNVRYNWEIYVKKEVEITFSSIFVILRTENTIEKWMYREQ